MATPLIGRGAITAFVQPIAEVTARAVALIIASAPDATGDGTSARMRHSLHSALQRRSGRVQGCREG